MPNPFPLPIPARRLLERAPRGLAAFLSVGVTGLAVHMALVGVLTHLFLLTSRAPMASQAGWARSLAWWIALAVATFITWRLNRRFTFATAGKASGAEVRRYVLVTLVAQGISFSVFKLVGAFLPWFPPSLAVLPGAVVATLFSYTGQRFFTFAAPNVEAAVIPEIPVI